MNINVAEKKVNSFSIGNPASGLGDAIVGTYGPTKPGQCDQEQPPVDFVGSGDNDGYDWEDFKRDAGKAWDLFKEIWPIVQPIFFR